MKFLFQVKHSESHCLNLSIAVVEPRIYVEYEHIVEVLLIWVSMSLKWMMKVETFEAHVTRMFAEHLEFAVI